MLHPRVVRLEAGQGTLVGKVVMKFWRSVCPPTPDLISLLDELCLEPCVDPSLTQGVLLLYDTPERVFARSCVEPQELAHQFSQLRVQAADTLVISTWRLESIGLEALRRWFEEASLPRLEDAQPPGVDPLLALLMQRLLRLDPSLLHAYLDLELAAELIGDTPDTHYLQRLSAATASPQSLLRSWHLQQTSLDDARKEAELTLRQLDQVLEEQEATALRCLAHDKLKTELSEAREEAELTLLQLHQVQEELESVFLQSRELEGKLKTLRGERDAALQAKKKRQEELRVAREGADLTLQQLRQLQEELQRQFLENRQFAKLASRTAALTRTLWIEHLTAR